MWRMKNNDLEARIGIPDGFKVKGGDGRAISSWNEVKNADGYILSYYSCLLYTSPSPRDTR